MELTKADRYLLEAIRRGDQEGWRQLVERHQGRLLAFAAGRVAQRADAEDLVQDTFVSFLKNLLNFRAQAGLETYLFTILRNKIISRYRSQATAKVTLIGDVMPADSSPGGSNGFAHIADADPSASWYVRRDEHEDLLANALTHSIRDMIEEFKRGLKFEDLKLIDLLFFARVANNVAARTLGVSDNRVAVNKHRYLDRIRKGLGRVDLPADFPIAQLENLLADIWTAYRPSCPKRSTIGGWLLGSLEADWADYVGFHVDRLGCRFCQANRDDLQAAAQAPDPAAFNQRIMESTVGFLSVGR
ncbi:MAG: sigma-70 family RNA polymerase sigma factor [Sedimentisphaerales bacterium]|nr:sigma-70 family RNA polymerase sigma factor [Sedimentisphaerales bacterium]